SHAGRAVGPTCAISNRPIASTSGKTVGYRRAQVCNYIGRGSSLGHDSEPTPGIVRLPGALTPRRRRFRQTLFRQSTHPLRIVQSAAKSRWMFSDLVGLDLALTGPSLHSNASRSDAERKPTTINRHRSYKRRNWMTE